MISDALISDALMSDALISDALKDGSRQELCCGSGCVVRELPIG